MIAGKNKQDGQLPSSSSPSADDLASSTSLDGVQDADSVRYPKNIIPPEESSDPFTFNNFASKKWTVFKAYIRRLRVIFHVACSRQFRVYNRSIGQAKQDCSVLFTLGCIISLLYGLINLGSNAGSFPAQVSEASAIKI